MLDRHLEACHAPNHINHRRHARAHSAANIKARVVRRFVDTHIERCYYRACYIPDVHEVTPCRTVTVQCHASKLTRRSPKCIGDNPRSVKVGTPTVRARNIKDSERDSRYCRCRGQRLQQALGRKLGHSVWTFWMA